MVLSVVGRVFNNRLVCLDKEGVCMKGTLDSELHG